MLVERIWPGNRLRNFHYLVACPETGEALAVDPLDWKLMLSTATAGRIDDPLDDEDDDEDDDDNEGSATAE